MQLPVNGNSGPRDADPKLKSDQASHKDTAKSKDELLKDEEIGTESTPAVVEDTASDSGTDLETDDSKVGSNTDVDIDNKHSGNADPL